MAWPAGAAGFVASGDWVRSVVADRMRKAKLQIGTRKAFTKVSPGDESGWFNRTWGDWEKQERRRIWRRSPEEGRREFPPGGFARDDRRENRASYGVRRLWLSWRRRLVRTWCW